MNLASWCQQLLAGQAIVPLIHHWLMIQGQRSMRGLRMNTLGWFDFKSAWFAPQNHNTFVIFTKSLQYRRSQRGAASLLMCAEIIPVEPDPDNAGEGI
jgi:hypothetical protein